MPWIPIDIFFGGCANFFRSKLDRLIVERCRPSHFIIWYYWPNDRRLLFRTCASEFCVRTRIRSFQWITSKTTVSAFMMNRNGICLRLIDSSTQTNTSTGKKLAHDQLKSSPQICLIQRPMWCEYHLEKKMHRFSLPIIDVDSLRQNVTFFSPLIF